MEQNQPFKKRMVENQNYYSQTQPTNGGLQNKPQIRQVQYIQYVPSNECNLETLSQAFKQEIQPYNPEPKEAQTQVVRIDHYEAPMMLNAWTQINTDDFPPLKSSKEAELLAKIQQLEQTLKQQSELISKISKSNTQSPSPVRILPKPSENIHTERVPIGYRIINQMKGPNNETQIEIEIKDDEDDTQDNQCGEVSVPHHNDDQKENDLIEHMYAQITTTPSSTPKAQKSVEKGGPLVSIGPNDTKVPAAEFEKLSWSSASIATRKLLGFIFDRETLATHSMTGKASPAFKDLDKPVKRKLDSRAVEDIIFAVTKKCGVSAKEVRSAITTKCADENKMLKLKALKNIESKRSILTDINNKKKIKKT